MQKSWIENNEIIIFYFAYDRIMSDKSVEIIDQNKKFKIMTFVLKKSTLKITFRFDIINDFNIQILHITDIDIENCMIYNIFNEKNQLSSTSNEYTVDRSLTKIELSSNSIICDDFNAHHAWWNFRIFFFIRTNFLIDWLIKNQCELMNISNEIIFSKQCIMKNDQNQTSTLIIDLIFAILYMINKIINWSINENAVTKSDHEIIEFLIICKNIETVDNFINKTLNVDKTDWNKFEKYLKSMYESNIISMQKLIENFTSINLKNEIILLQSIINEAASISIFKRKSCEKFKKWWYKRLITLKKTMTIHKKFYKRYYSNFDFDNFKKTRNEYFHEIRKIKKFCWIEFFENVVDKKIFLIYKFIKNNRIEKLFSINHNEKICIDFDQKCNAFIDVMFLFFSKIQKNLTDQFIIYEFSVKK